MSTGYKVLVVLHVLSVIGGFGAVSYNALYASLARRHPSLEGSAAILQANTLVSGLAELLIYAALLFGIGAVGASGSTVKFSQGWVAGGIAAYVLDLGILHGWIRPQQRRYQAVLRELEESGGERAQAVKLQLLERRVSAGWAAFNLLVVAAVYLMVFKPGS